MFIKKKKSISYLVADTNLQLIVDADDARKLDKTGVVKAALDPQVVAVTHEIIPLVHVNTVPLVRYYLSKNKATNTCSALINK
jgi:hypothetical protein